MVGDVDSIRKGLQRLPTNFGTDAAWVGSSGQIVLVPLHSATDAGSLSVEYTLIDTGDRS
jgi:hypothetical protein